MRGLQYWKDQDKFGNDHFLRDTYSCKEELYLTFFPGIDNRSMDAWVPRVSKKDAEVKPKFSTHIWRIDVEYIKDQA